MKFHNMILRHDPYKEKKLLKIAEYIISEDSCSPEGCHCCPIGITEQLIEKNQITTSCLATTVGRYRESSFFSNIKTINKYGIVESSGALRKMLCEEYLSIFSKPKYQHEELEI